MTTVHCQNVTKIFTMTSTVDYFLLETMSMLALGKVYLWLIPDKSLTTIS